MRKIMYKWKKIQIFKTIFFADKNIQTICLHGSPTQCLGFVKLTFSNCVHLETDRCQVFVVKNFASVKNKSRFHHPPVNSFVVQLLKHA